MYQENWRQCSSCFVLFFGGHPGCCPVTGGPHDPSKSLNYSLLHFSRSSGNLKTKSKQDDSTRHGHLDEEPQKKEQSNEEEAKSSEDSEPLPPKENLSRGWRWCTFCSQLFDESSSAQPLTTSPLSSSFTSAHPNSELSSLSVSSLHSHQVLSAPHCASLLPTQHQPQTSFTSPRSFSLSTITPPSHATTSATSLPSTASSTSSSLLTIPTHSLCISSKEGHRADANSEFALFLKPSSETQAVHPDWKRCKLCGGLFHSQAGDEKEKGTGKKLCVGGAHHLTETSDHHLYSLLFRPSSTY
eukprot:TRINITY_DN7210_c0_g1_i1.p1 TRINITY_DN7210_c0_g1~~TRINITY_DN7210_c0_g1_i1.p1  ORF type:complete len:310 (+),score=65.85 TRINITY_DN7210_c0_g1_i1:31-930(+)